MRFKRYIREDASPEERCINMVKAAFGNDGMVQLSKNEIKSYVRDNSEGDISLDYINQIIGDMVRRGDLASVGGSDKYELRSMDNE